MDADMTLDAVGVGAGPFNLSLAALLAPTGLNARFFEKNTESERQLARSSISA
jgi:lysine/ornithine N-monooxygenase